MTIDFETIPSGKDGLSKLRKEINSIYDITHLESWKHHPQTYYENEVWFTYNHDRNTPPLQLRVIGDSYLKLFTTPRGQPHFDNKGYQYLAGRGFKKKQSAIKWVREIFKCDTFSDFEFGELEKEEITYWTAYDIISEAMSYDMNSKKIREEGDIKIALPTKNKMEYTSCTKCNEEMIESIIHLGTHLEVFLWDLTTNYPILEGEYCPYCEYHDITLKDENSDIVCRRHVT